jgi:nitrogen regulatory protein PII
MGDGKIFISPIESVIRVSTGRKARKRFNIPPVGKEGV